MEDIMTFETLFPEEFVQALLALLAAIVLDLTLGVSVSIKLKVFDLKKVADFYSSSVLPNLLGWGVANITLRLAGTLEQPLITMLANAGIVSLYGLAAAALIGSIVEKMTVLRAPAPVAPKVVTVEVTMPTIATPTPTAAVVTPPPVAVKAKQETKDGL